MAFFETVGLVVFIRLEGGAVVSATNEAPITLYFDSPGCQGQPFVNFLGNAGVIIPTPPGASEPFLAGRTSGVRLGPPAFESLLTTVGVCEAIQQVLDESIPADPFDTSLLPFTGPSVPVPLHIELAE